MVSACLQRNCVQAVPSLVTSVWPSRHLKPDSRPVWRWVGDCRQFTGARDRQPKVHARCCGTLSEFSSLMMSPHLQSLLMPGLAVYRDFVEQDPVRGRPRERVCDRSPWPYSYKCVSEKTRTRLETTEVAFLAQQPPVNEEKECRYEIWHSPAEHCERVPSSHSLPHSP